MLERDYNSQFFGIFYTQPLTDATVTHSHGIFPDLIISWTLSNSPIYADFFFFLFKHISCTFVHNITLLCV